MTSLATLRLNEISRYGRSDRGQINIVQAALTG